jgi:N-acetylmuramoyl-L-alanine amidase
VDDTDRYTAALSGALGKALSIEVPIIGKDMAEAYYVTKMLSMPSVLIEMGFITNSDDAVNLLSDGWRDTFVAGAVQGILDYIAAQD